MKEKLKIIYNRFVTLSLAKKIELIAASFFTVLSLMIIPVVAWFSNQRKVAELQKIQYPNSLFINAAYREDQINFGLDSVDINEYARDNNGDFILETNGNGQLVAKKIDKKEYVFSVSGTNTSHFTLQLAHTNNNLFIYKIYEATQYNQAMYDALSDENKAKCIPYSTTENAHTENDLVVHDPTISQSGADDPTVDGEGNATYYYEGQSLYYMKGTEVAGTPLNQIKNSKLAIKNTGNYYYSETYDSYVAVENHSVPSYWQKTEIPTSDDQQALANKKPFCRYYILEITWDGEQSSNEKKETDMVYLAVERED